MEKFSSTHLLLQVQQGHFGLIVGAKLLQLMPHS
jgi:hypothetical protein